MSQSSRESLESMLDCSLVKVELGNTDGQQDNDDTMFLAPHVPLSSEYDTASEETMVSYKTSIFSVYCEPCEYMCACVLCSPGDN